MPVTPIDLTQPQRPYGTAIPGTQNPDQFTSPGFVSPPGLLNTPFAAPPVAASPQAALSSAAPPPAVPSLGLLNTPATPAPYTANQSTAKPANAVGYNPVGFSVDKNQTVAGQVDSLIAKDSPLMQQATTRAMQRSNASGLLHSSSAVGAGEAALIGAALPIAQQDASTYNAAHTNTQNATNAALNFGAQATNTASGQNAQLGTSVSMANAESANKALQDSFQSKSNYGLATLDANTKISLSNLDTATKVKITTMENQNRQFLQANQGASSMFSQTMTEIANLYQNHPEIPGEAKDAQRDQLLNMLQEGLRQQGDVAGLNLGSYYTQGGGNLSGGAHFSNLPLRTDIPNGGHRDAQGNVYNADGSQAGWVGPTGGATYVGTNGTIYTDATAWANAPRDGAAPTGTTPAPGSPGNTPATPDNWQSGMPVPPGYQVLDPSKSGFGPGVPIISGPPRLVPITGGDTAPTGTVTNPSGALTDAERSNYNNGVPPRPGLRWDNRRGWK